MRRATSGSFNCGCALRQQRGDFGDGAFGLAARVGAAVDRQLGGVLRALAAVEGVAQRLAVIAGGDGLFGSLERVDGGGEFSGGELVGAGGAGRVDRALRLIHFLAGRLGAAGREDGGDERQAANHTKHVSRVYVSGARAAGAPRAPERASISYHEGSGAMASVPVVDRPREKLARVGAEALGDNELVALVLGSGTRSRGALLVAHDVIEAADGVQGLVRIGLDELCRMPGVGQSRAARLLAAVELGRRDVVRRSRGAAADAVDGATWSSYLAPRYSGFGVERFGVMLLDQKQRVIRSVILSTGTIEASISHPRDVFRVAMLAQASFVVAFHNHPSGDPLAERRRPVDDAAAVRGGRGGRHRADGSHHPGRAGTFFSFRAEGLD